MSTSRREVITGIGAGAAALAIGSRPGRSQQASPVKVIDVHGHYTTFPPALREFRQKQIAAVQDPSQAPSKAMLNFSDDQMRESVQQQLKFQRERGTDVTLFSPQAAGMGHHLGNAATSL